MITTVDEDEMHPGARLRALLTGPRPALLMEAHDGVSARVAAQAGFKAIWASGLTLSSAAGYRDCNEMAWTELTEKVAVLIEGSCRPVLVDGDNGFGNHNNFRLLVRRLNALGASGVVVEDKLFPKLNSLASGPQQLESVRSFCGKLRAGLDARTDGSFMIVARVEALIAGLTVNEALDRASSYHECGADAVLVQSREPNAKQVFSFADRWQARTPLLLVPTTYAATPPSRYEEHRIGGVICANHNLRSAMRAMQDVCARILEAGGVHVLGDEIASIAELFDLMNYAELSDARRRYE